MRVARGRARITARWPARAAERPRGGGGSGEETLQRRPVVGKGEGELGRGEVAAAFVFCRGDPSQPLRRQRTGYCTALYFVRLRLRDAFVLQRPTPVERGRQTTAEPEI